MKLFEDEFKQVLVYADEEMQDVLLNGSAVTSDQFAGWTLKGAEVTNEGNQLVWYNDTANLLSVWNVDSNWNYVSYEAVSENDIVPFNKIEANFYQDFNNSTL